MLADLPLVTVFPLFLAFFLEGSGAAGARRPFVSVVFMGAIYRAVDSLLSSLLIASTSGVDDWLFLRTIMFVIIGASPVVVLIKEFYVLNLDGIEAWEEGGPTLGADRLRL